MSLRLVAFAAGSAASHFWVLVLLAAKQAAQWDRSEGRPRWELPAYPIEMIAVASATITCLTPYFAEDLGPIAQCALRVLCFFYACKILDLGLCRAQAPPVRLVEDVTESHQALIDEKKDNESQTDEAKAASDEKARVPAVGLTELEKHIKSTPAPMSSLSDKITYVWLLATQMRYHSFDIVVRQRDRDPEKNLPARKVLSDAALTVVICLPLIWYFGLEARTFIGTGHGPLLVLQITLEVLHLVVHPYCSRRLFQTPTGASSMRDFWTTQWHACAAPFLKSLAYSPVKKLTNSRAAGVLAAFCLSGLWHAWAAAPLSTEPLYVGSLIWGVFMVCGLWCLIESHPGSKKQAAAERFTVFVLAFWACSAGQLYSTVPWLRFSVEGSDPPDIYCQPACLE